MKTINTAAVQAIVIGTISLISMESVNAKVFEGKLGDAPSCTVGHYGDIYFDEKADDMRICDENNSWNLLSSYIDIDKAIQNLECEVSTKVNTNKSEEKLKFSYFWIEFVDKKHLVFCSIENITKNKTILINAHFMPEGIYEPARCQLEDDDMGLEMFPSTLSKEDKLHKVVVSKGRILIDESLCKSKVYRKNLIGLENK